MTPNSAEALFRKSSATFFSSSLFFPPETRKKVTTLYAFVRTADDFVDATPQQAEEFQRFCDRYRAAVREGGCGFPPIDDFCCLAREHAFEQEWVDAFLAAMAQDLWKRTYADLSETEAYMYGSAEVVGMMMARILELPDRLLPEARLLGRSFQYINFLRDIAEDEERGRCYLPQDEILRWGLRSLSLEEAESKPEAFRAFMRTQVDRYRAWRREAQPGIDAIPSALRVAILTAADMYDRTARAIEAEPLAVYRRRLKPKRLTVALAAVKNGIKVKWL